MSSSFTKAALDRLGAVLLLLIAAPWLLVIALAIKFENSGPVLCRDRRVGLFGEEFDLLRFRTSAEHPQDATPVERLLRRFSLDELPQLVNVLAGQMSLVGPRPAHPAVPEEADAAASRLSVKPGLTGLWYLGCASRVDPDGPAGVAEYSRNWTLGMDIGILWRTLRSGARGHGAF